MSGNDSIRERFKAALAAFPIDLPYDVEEQRPHANTDLLEKAERWSGLGDRDNYEQAPAGNDQVLISYQPPVALSEAQEKRLAESATHLNEQIRLSWATKSLEENRPADGWTLAEAITFARERDSKTLFNIRLDVGGARPT